MSPTFVRTWWLEARAVAARLGRRGPSDAPDDLAQDLAIRLLEGRAIVDRPGAWLERIARNQIIDSWRVEQRRAELAPNIEAPVGVQDPETQLLTGERRRVVRRALLELPRRQRQAVLLRFHGDMPLHAVAARLGAAPATTRTRVHRALAALRARVQGLRSLLIGWHGTRATVLGLTIASAAGVTPQLEVPRPKNEGTVLALPIHPALHVLARHSSLEAAPLGSKETLPAVTPHRPAKRDSGAESQIAPALQEFRFDDDNIDGSVKGPEGESIVVATPSAEPSLIEVRRHFIPELLKSLEEL